MLQSSAARALKPRTKIRHAEAREQEALTEIWLPARGYPGARNYEVSNHGRVRSIARVDSRGNKRAMKILRPGNTGTGYLQVQICCEGVVRKVMVHRLVLEAFVGPCPDGMEACHDPDPDRSNCRLDNLRWDTRLANRRDQIKHRVNRRRFGRHGNAKFFATDIERVKDLRCAGCSYRDIGTWLSMDASHAWDIVHENVWRHTSPGAK